jgi:hypothetical protein
MYTLSTGNLGVKGLGWHASSASLLAATSNAHACSYGSWRQYQYDEPISEEKVEMQKQNRWPQKAKREPHFFPAKFDRSIGGHHLVGYCQSMVLQYPFENGRPSMAG